LRFSEHIPISDAGPLPSDIARITCLVDVVGLVCVVIRVVLWETDLEIPGRTLKDGKVAGRLLKEASVFGLGFDDVVLIALTALQVLGLVRVVSIE
jgi:hypothetical protein